MALGERIPTDFIAARKRQRILKALAELLDEKGYRGTRIADIVGRAGVARKTFYDNFGGKDDAVRALVAKALPDLYEQVDLSSIDRTGLGLFAVELAATAEAGEGQDAVSRANPVAQALRDILGSVVITEPEPEQMCSLPPGRHGLPREFVTTNQRSRLFAGLAVAVAERGYGAATIAHITKAAAVSRRSFYEHFPSKEEAAYALVKEATPGIWVATYSSDGFKALTVEVVALRIAQGHEAAAAVVNETGAALRVLGDKHEQVAA